MFFSYSNLNSQCEQVPVYFERNTVDSNGKIGHVMQIYAKFVAKILNH